MVAMEREEVDKMLYVKRKLENNPKVFYNAWHRKHQYTQKLGLEHFGRRGLNTNFIRRLKDTVALCFGSVLDVGCQRGAYIFHLKNNTNVTDIVGVDISEVVISQAKAFQPDIKFVVGDISNLPFRSGSFDTVIASEILEHLSVLEPAVSELLRVAKEQVIISVPNEPKTIKDKTHLRFFEKEDLIKLFQGYEVEFIETKALNHIVRIIK